MKRFILMLVMLLPAMVMAQEKDAGLLKDQPGAAGSVQNGALSTTHSEGAFFAPSRNTSIASALGRRLSALAPQEKKSSQSKKPEKPERPPIEGSMVGYIDNAIVGSQIRIRFDAAFDNNSPDRAEFFYAKCGCFRNLAVAPSPTNQAVDPNAPGPGLGVPKTLNFQQLYLTGEYAPTSRFSVFVEVPLRWIQPQGFLSMPPFPGFSNQAGLSDVQAGFKLATLASSHHYLTFQFRTYFPSGDASKGLGTNHYSIEPSVLYYQRVTNRMALEAQLGDWHPIGGSDGVPVSSSEGFAGDVFYYGIGPSYALYRGERVRFSPVLEMVGWRVLGGFQTLPGGPVLGAGAEVSGINTVNLKAGARTSIGGHNSFYVGFGQALTHDHWYKHIVRLEYRYSF